MKKITNLEEQNAILGKEENWTYKQIKSACNWEKAIYKGEWKWEKKTQTWVAENEQAKQDNTNFIEELKKDKASDPAEPPFCGIWDG